MDDKKKILLIIEDDKHLLKALLEKFSRENLEVITATDGEKGLELSLSLRPDLILLDIVLPKMDGITVLKKIREAEGGDKMDIIILTNLSGAAKTAEAIESGVYDYLVKTDWKLSDVVDMVKDRLD